MARTRTIIVDDIPPSYNKYLGKDTRFAYARDKKLWEQIIHVAVIGFLPCDAFDSFEINLHYIFPDKRCRDLDNLAGKFIFDPLVKFGIIKDDNAFCLQRLKIDSEVKRKIKKTVITIEEIE